jgi:hypothetical protein
VSKNPNRVVIECTAEKYTTVVYADDKELYRAEFRMVDSGAEMVMGGEVHDALRDHGRLADAVDNLDFGPFDVSVALKEIGEEPV